jgi:hypothetical protein
MPRVDQHDLDRWRELARTLGEQADQQEHALEDLPVEDREEIAARIRWRRRELAVVLDKLDQLEEDLFARDVLRDLQGL